MADQSAGRAKLLEYNATLTDRIDLTDKLAIFKVRPDASDNYPGGKIPEFLPGQYAVLGLNNEANPDLGKTVRAYSIASPPQQDDELEFYIRFVDEPVSDNPLTHMLWRLKSGDRLHIGPKLRGKFTLEDTVGPDDHRLKLLVAAGTGLAPFYSMVMWHDHLKKNSGSRLVILHGASYESDLGYRRELDDLCKRNGSIGYINTISRPQHCPGWSGHCGRVESFFSPKEVPALEEKLGLGKGGLNPENVVIYICGLVGTIHNVLDHCLHLGFVPENRRVRRALNLEGHEPTLFYEQYDTTPVIDINDSAKLEEMLAGTPFEGQLKAPIS